MTQQHSYKMRDLLRKDSFTIAVGCNAVGVLRSNGTKEIILLDGYGYTNQRQAFCVTCH